MEDDTPRTKRCGMCDKYLPLDAFNKSRAAKDGRCARCRACDSEYKKAHRAKYPERHRDAERRRYTGKRREKIIAAARTRYLADPEKWNADQRARRAADPERVRVRDRAYRRANRDQILQWKREWYQRHAEEVKAYSRERYWADPERFRREVLDWQKRNPEIVAEHNRRQRARKVAATIGVITVDLLAAKLAYWGWRCWICGGDPNTWDHVKPLAKGGPHMLANLRPACWSCNSSKSDRWPLAV